MNTDKLQEVYRIAEAGIGAIENALNDSLAGKDPQFQLVALKQGRDLLKDAVDMASDLIVESVS